MHAQIITIDGLAGSGKGEISRFLARRLEFRRLDSGSIYRTITLACLQKGFNPRDEHTLKRMVIFAQKEYEQAAFTVENDAFCYKGVHFENEIRSRKISYLTPYVAQIPGIRKIVLPIQREFSWRDCPRGLVAEGRDMGTVVFPNAQLKIFLEADLITRASRRFHQLQREGKWHSFHKVLSDLAKRDNLDTTRDISPTVRSSDAHTVLNEGELLEDVVDTIVALWKKS